MMIIKKYREKTTLKPVMGANIREKYYGKYKN